MEEAASGGIKDVYFQDCEGNGVLINNYPFLDEEEVEETTVMEIPPGEEIIGV